MKPIRGKDMTFSELLDPIATIETKEEAEEYKACLIEYYMTEYGKSHDEAVRVAKTNIGYWAGYYDEATAKRIWELFNTKHPVFGTSWPTLDEALKAGLAIGRSRRRHEEKKTK